MHEWRNSSSAARVAVTSYGWFGSIPDSDGGVLNDGSQSEAAIRLTPPNGCFWPKPGIHLIPVNARFRCVANFGFVSNKRLFDKHHFIDRI